MKDLFVVLTVLASLSFPLLYWREMKKGRISPTVSTWVVFSVSTILSLTTYALAQNHDFKSGILNTTDAFQTFIILIMVIIWGKKGQFSRFEKYYLSGIGVVVAYGVVSGNAFSSNLFIQILICSGYIPTIAKMVRLRKNTEQFLPWVFPLIAGMLGIYPAIVGGNTLAALYAIRTVAMILILMSVMVYYRRT